MLAYGNIYSFNFLPPANEVAGRECFHKCQRVMYDKHNPVCATSQPNPHTTWLNDGPHPERLPLA